jgi:tetrahydromethanopterin S-methyltransferase subunit G
MSKIQSGIRILYGILVGIWIVGFSIIMMF